ncbi:MAG: SUMF1/EgtB/PvdO family nonheme iron enzyme [Candidatus Omnitrophota bacterium]
MSISSLNSYAQDTTADTLTFQFNISWNNSWRDAVNYDAAWVFLKYSKDSGVTWNQMTMKTSGTNPAGTSIGTGTPIDLIVPLDREGFFIQRSAAAGGTGTLSTSSVRCVWDYNADGLTDATANGMTCQFKIFGIEMVYIPQGNFYAGDGATSSIYGNFESGTSGAALQITSENQLTLGGGGLGNNNTAGEAASALDDFSDATSKTLPATFPKGYKAFYLMKYEITEGMYASFLNTLSRLQQNMRVSSNITADAPTSGSIYVMSSTSAITTRSTILCPSAGNGTVNPIVFSTTRPDRATAYLTWMDLAAFADWAALRPMTELEFEKACRGPGAPVANEYAWGSTAITAATTIAGTEDGTETIGTANANCRYSNNNMTGGDTGLGPLRCGIFATAISTRATAGAGYYGNMELSGNVWERTVTVGEATGRAFTGTHGDGVLTTTASYQGNATNLDWPGIDTTPARGVTGTTTVGFGVRGGSYVELTVYLQVSNRYLGAYYITTRGLNMGGRAARTAE